MVIQHPGKVVVVFYYIPLFLQRIKPTLASLSKEGDLWGKCGGSSQNSQAHEGPDLRN